MADRQTVHVSPHRYDQEVADFWWIGAHRIAYSIDEIIRKALRAHAGLVDE